MAETYRKEVVVRLIQCKRTGRYLAADEWVGEPAKAIRFASSVAALNCCLVGGLREVELVLQMPHLGQEVFRASIP
jgi:hypothetical protein